MAKIACLRVALSVFNVIFFLIGIALIIFGIVVQVKFNDYLEFFPGVISSLAILVIIIGVVVVFVSSMGCVGVVMKNHKLVFGFTLFVLIIFVLQIAAGITGFAIRGKIKAYVEIEMQSSMRFYGMPNMLGKDFDAITRAWDFVQTELYCCGVQSFCDWKNSVFNGMNGELDNKVPDTCCKHPRPGCGEHALPPSREKCEKQAETVQRGNPPTPHRPGQNPEYASVLNLNGCGSKISSMGVNYAVAFAVVAILFAILEIIGIALSAILAHDLMREGKGAA